MLGMIAKVGADSCHIAVGVAVTLAATAVVAVTVGTGGIGGFIAVALVSSLLMH